MEALEEWQFFMLHGTAGPCNWWECRNHIGGPFTRSWTTRLTEVPEIGKWHRIGIASIGDWISLFVDGELKVQQTDDLHSSGGVFLFANDALVEFDNVVIMGPDIPGKDASCI